jgi:hypothetical protein
MAITMNNHAMVIILLRGGGKPSTKNLNNALCTNVHIYDDLIKYF